MALFRPAQSDTLPTVPARVRQAVLFVLTLAVATLCYLASGNVIASAVLPCVHAGFRTFCSGWWILSVDPQRFRARTCFAYYVAAACWKAALAALLSIGTFIVVAMRTGAEPTMEEFAATMWVLIIGIALNTALGGAATVAAIKGHVRVWVHPRLETMLRGDLRLAARHVSRRAGFNFAIFVLGTAIVFPLTAVGALVLAVLTVGMGRHEVVGSFASIVGGVAIFLLPATGLFAYAWLSARVIARHPTECWPPDTLAQVG